MPPQPGKDYSQQTYRGTYAAAQPWAAYGMAPSSGTPQTGYAPKNVHGGGFVMSQPQGNSPLPKPAGVGYMPSQSSGGYYPNGALGSGYLPSQPQGYAPKKVHGGGFVMGQSQTGSIQPEAYNYGNSRAAVPECPPAGSRSTGGSGTNCHFSFKRQTMLMLT
jgi:hypothetical protein